MYTTHPDEISSMEKDHDRKLRGGVGCQWSEDVEIETILTDLLGTEKITQWKFAWHCLGAAGRVSGGLEYARPGEGGSASVKQWTCSIKFLPTRYCIVMQTD